MMSAYLQGCKLDVTWLVRARTVSTPDRRPFSPWLYLSQCGLTEMQVEHLFTIPIAEDAPTRVAAVYQSRPTALKPLAEKLVSLANQAGGVLSGRRFDSLGALVLALLAEQAAPGTDAASPLCEPLVRQLCLLFSGFADRAEYGGRDVWLCKKAQARSAAGRRGGGLTRVVQVLAADLMYALGSRDPYDRPSHSPSIVVFLMTADCSRFRFADADQLTCCADNVVPAVLRQLGVLRLSERLAADIDGGVSVAGDREVCMPREVPVRAGAEERRLQVELRALSVVAVDELARVAQQSGKVGAAASCLMLSVCSLTSVTAVVECDRYQLLLVAAGQGTGVPRRAAAQQQAHVVLLKRTRIHKSNSVFLARFQSRLPVCGTRRRYKLPHRDLTRPARHAVVVAVAVVAVGSQGNVPLAGTGRQQRTPRRKPCRAHRVRRGGKAAQRLTVGGGEEADQAVLGAGAQHAAERVHVEADALVGVARPAEVEQEARGVAQVPTVDARALAAASEQQRARRVEGHLRDARVARQRGHHVARARVDERGRVGERARSEQVAARGHAQRRDDACTARHT
jgi:hypothetical protein